MIRRVYVEKREEFRQEARALRDDICRDLRIEGLGAVRHLLRYDVEGISEEVWETSKQSLFSEPAIEVIFEKAPWEPDSTVFAVEYLPGQFDQRADSAQQCLKILADCDPVVRCAEVYILEGQLPDEEVARIKAYRINPVDSREAALERPETLRHPVPEPESVATLEGFRSGDSFFLNALHKELGLAMSLEDLAFCQQWFKEEAGRDPSLTEIKLLDTYWSDHCRHTTFLTEITSVEIESGPLSGGIESAWASYKAAREDVYGKDPSGRPVCLMDIALMGMKSLRKAGKLPELEVSEEVNAASIVVPVERDGATEEWLVMFKNETHNHPTEIEPFGGAATCLGGAIRDPLSGRSYVYQAMRVTGCADPRQEVSQTLPGKLPQKKITLEAAHGYSSYGNQIGLATGMVNEVYHPGYVAKRMEIGAVIAAAPRSQVVRGTPEPGDVIVLVGGSTGRDGIGGATGSSKEHTDTALENAAEVQKGDPPMERKLQRLFRDPEVSGMIKRCNDFGAGGVSVAIGELADGLEIDLDAVPLKYDGLDGTEIALSESQERMAVVLDPKDLQAFLDHSAAENLQAVKVADVTEEARLKMTWRGQTIVDISRKFLDTNGVRQQAAVKVTHPTGQNPLLLEEETIPLKTQWEERLSELNVCSQKGLVERFDSTIGAGSVLHPFGGAERITPTEAMAAKIPLLEGDTRMGTLMSFGFHPEVAAWSPFHGALYAVIESVSRLVATGGRLEDTYLTFQEYFEKLRNDPARWGKPFAALLGAWLVQKELGIAAIGGKDSMSGSFKDMDVPPTLVSFAVCPVEVSRVISPEFKGADHPVARVSIPNDGSGMPDWDVLKRNYESITNAIARGDVLSASVVREGGMAAAVSKMSFGNKIGMNFEGEVSRSELFGRDFGAILLELKPGVEASSLNGEYVGRTCSEPFITVNGESLSLDRLRKVWEAPLESVFPTHVEVEKKSVNLQMFEPHSIRGSKSRAARPRVLIPVFPGTNCEYDSARAFEAAGAEAEILVIRNRTHSEIEESLQALEKKIDQAQILMLSGGFSAGDEPGGSGKFIASVFRNERVAEATRRLYKERDGLILGICNGFQALVKLGLLPYGKIQPMAADHPSLTVNHLGRHVSCYVRTKVVSRLSPWLSECPLGQETLTPVSHGEGRFVGSSEVLASLFRNDQVATQYVDANGKPTLQLPDNPNGSMEAIEGITSPCGRIFGKMGHSERVGSYVGINIPGNKVQPIFASGVKYFSG
ncbi:phosphoribosylformylglycinamidine synthase [Puniceicoccales bacterium CK1056]|uniref:Phosphoribosylformylglycinamidine synthase n=1 Tax=Oceanipulchritudo coccoides TaxID=2706888 RepID=A0A6B2M0B9_9BACT|nr:phosphoribosylformylglycinamidine synthase [Oceanipulchritudo coccoides]NDV61205.1 phosphoribosylformylglycinamidine synthase [Oceanipulchritudo coccoides]